MGFGKNQDISCNIYSTNFLEGSGNFYLFS